MEENNKIIAEFMNFPKITNVRDSESGKYYDYWLPNNFNLILEQEIQIESNNGWGLVHQDCVFVRDLIFHSDWNWLMEVVEKIEKEFCSTNIHYYSQKQMYSVEFLGFNIEYDNSEYGDDKMKILYNSCVKFINFYNKRKEK
mgnify:CR=1 FL=1